jgi:predicted AAA+ superfamily ATPase
MVDLLLVRRLEPWGGNIKKRLVKSPRTYVRDSGIVHNLLQIPDYEALLGHPVLGKSWEGFVIENIISVLPSGTHSFFYRSSAGAEIDLVLEFGLDDYWGVEIKASRTPAVKKGFHVACHDLNVKKKFVVYTGIDKFPGQGDTTILSLSHFIEALRERTGYRS